MHDVHTLQLAPVKLRSLEIKEALDLIQKESVNIIREKCENRTINRLASYRESVKEATGYDGTFTIAYYLSDCQTEHARVIDLPE